MRTSNLNVTDSHITAVNTQPPQVIGGTRVITGAAGSSSDAKKGAAMKDSKTIWKVEELPTEVRQPLTIHDTLTPSAHR